MVLIAVEDKLWINQILILWVTITKEWLAILVPLLTAGLICEPSHLQNYDMMSQFC